MHVKPSCVAAREQRDIWRHPSGRACPRGAGDPAARTPAARPCGLCLPRAQRLSCARAPQRVPENPEPGPGGSRLRTPTAVPGWHRRGPRAPPAQQAREGGAWLGRPGRRVLPCARRPAGRDGARTALRSCRPAGARGRGRPQPRGTQAAATAAATGSGDPERGPDPWHVKSRLCLRYSFVCFEDAGGGRLNGKVYGPTVQQLVALRGKPGGPWPSVPVFPLGNKTFRDGLSSRATEENDLNHRPFRTPSIRSLEACFQRALKRHRPSPPVLALVQKSPLGTAGSSSPDRVALRSSFIHDVCAPFTNTLETCTIFPALERTDLPLSFW